MCQVEIVTYKSYFYLLCFLNGNFIFKTYFLRYETNEKYDSLFYFKNIGLNNSVNLR